MAMRDRFGAVRMRGDFLADGMRDVDHRGDFLLRHLRLAGYAAEREHRAGGNHLEQVRAVVVAATRARSRNRPGPRATPA